MPLLDQGHLVCCQWIMFTWYAVTGSCSPGMLSFDHVHMVCHGIMFTQYTFIRSCPCSISWLYHIHSVCSHRIMFTWYALIRSCSLGVLIRLCSLGMSSSALYVADYMVLITQSSLDYVHLVCPHEIMFKICMIAKYMDLITHRSTIMSLFTTPKWPASDHVQTMHGCQIHRLDHPYNIFFVYYLQQLPTKFTP